MSFPMKLNIAHGLRAFMGRVCFLVVCKPAPVQWRLLPDEVF